MHKNDKIILLTQEDKSELWGSLTDICKVKDLPYYSLAAKKLPFTYKGIKFTKLIYKQEYGIIKK